MGFIPDIYYKNLAGSLLEKMALQDKTLRGAAAQPLWRPAQNVRGNDWTAV
jgi:hypothetical protein